VPEIIDLTREFNINQVWTKILNGYRQNECLITVGTGTIPDELNVGLISSHCYAVLEIVEYNGTKLLLLKNPWGHYRWNGRFSHGDTLWTE
jgi:calpain-7